MKEVFFSSVFSVLTHLLSSSDILRIFNLEEGTFKNEPVASLEKKNNYCFTFFHREALSTAVCPVTWKSRALL